MLGREVKEEEEGEMAGRPSCTVGGPRGDRPPARKGGGLSVTRGRRPLLSQQQFALTSYAGWRG